MPAPRLRLPAQCPVLFGSVEALCELVTFRGKHKIPRSWSVCRCHGWGASAMLEGCFGLQATCCGCRQLQGTGILIAASHFPPEASWLPMQYQSSRSALWLLWLSVWEPQARCQCACGYKKQCPHASLTRKQPLGNCPNNHIAGQSTCRTPPFPMASAELPEAAASEGLAPEVWAFQTSLP